MRRPAPRADSAAPSFFNAIRKSLAFLPAVVWFALGFRSFLHSPGLYLYQTEIDSLSVPAAALLFLTAYALGNRILKRTASALTSLEEGILSIGLGMGLLGTSIFILGAFGLFKGWVFAALFGCICLICAGVFRKETILPPPLRLPVSAWLGFVALFLSALLAFTPEIYEDVLVYHFTVPKTYLEAGRILYIPNNVFSNMPMLVEIFYGAALGLSDAVCAHFIHWGFGLLSGLAILALSRRLFGISGWTGAALFWSLPVVMAIAGIGLVDLALCFFGMAGLLSIVAGGGSVFWAVLTGFFAGICLSIKYTGLWMALAILSFFLYKRMSAKRLLAASVVALAVFAPWLIKNLVLTGNPVYPFLWSFFGGQDWSETSSAIYLRHIEGFGVHDLWNILILPWHLFFHPRIFGGPLIQNKLGYALALGFFALPFVWPSLKTGFKKAAWPIFWVALFLYGTWALTLQEIRFLLPALAAACVFAGWLWESLEVHFRGRRDWLRFALGLAIFWNLVIFAKYLVHPIYPQSIRLFLGEGREKYLERVIHTFEAQRFLEARILKGETTLFIGENRTFYFKKRFISDTPFNGCELVRLVRAAREKPEDFSVNFKSLLSERNIRYIFISFRHLNYNSEPGFPYLDFTREESHLFQDELRTRARKIYRDGGVAIYDLKGS